MTRMVQRSLMLLVLVAVILVGRVSAASADLRQIVMFVDGTPLAVQQQVVALSGSTVLYNLSLITALAVLTNYQGLAFLESKVQGVCNPLLDLLCVVAGVYDDVLTFIDPICPTAAPPPTPESYRWGPQQIKVPAVDLQWSKIKGSAAVTVAVLDTGIQFHSELSGRIASGYNAITGTGQPADGHGHGTHMAGNIAADKNQQAIIGVTGVESSIKVAAVKVLDDDGAGYLSGVIDGMRWVYDNDIPLVNMSFGFSFSNQTDGTPLMKAVQKLYEAGVIMVASAGNRCTAAQAGEDGGGDSCGPAATCNAPLTDVTYPAAYGAWVIAVGATTVDQQVAAYSLSGPQLAVVAPGGARASGAPDNGQILSTNTGGIYGRGHGTSQAAAHVTGAAALALQLQPGLTPSEVRNLLTQTAVKLPSYSKNQQGAGRIDVQNMIKALLP
jgi:subtilisin family serine protease